MLEYRFYEKNSYKIDSQNLLSIRRAIKNVGGLATTSGVLMTS